MKYSDNAPRSNQAGPKTSTSVVAYWSMWMLPATVPPRNPSFDAVASSWMLPAPASADQFRARHSLPWICAVIGRSIWSIRYGVYGARVALASEVRKQSVPAFCIVVLQSRSLECEPRRGDHVARLEHERERIVVTLGCEIRATRALEYSSLRPVRCHRVVQARTARHESDGPRVVYTADQ